MKKDLFSIGTLMFVPLLVLALILSGCEGDDGERGPRGPAGGSVIDASTSSAATLATIDVQSKINSVSIASPPVVKFTVTDSSGAGIVGLADIKESNPTFVRFNLVKLVPGTNGNPDSWVSYIRDSDGLPGTESGGTLVDHGDGRYTYTFATDIKKVAGVSYQPNLTHRLGGQFGSSAIALEAQNFAYDFVPAGGAVTAMRNIATMSSCNECHGKLVFHGRRFEVEYCVTCHNPDLVVGPDSFNMSTMVHKIHSANSTYVDGDFAEVTYPQEKMCRKCHDGTDSATPQGNNWQTNPSIAACGGCHNIHFGTVPTPPLVAHTGGPQADNSGCVGCHSDTAINGYHMAVNVTPNNPEVPAGAANLTYEIKEVTVDGSNQPIITFRILSSVDGSTPTPVVLSGSGFTATTPVPANAVMNGFSGSPSFLIAYAMPQSGNLTPAEYNNLGKAAAQPASLSIAYLLAAANTRGTITGPIADGYYVATITNATYQFPVGATLRAVALQGYFTQVAGTNGLAEETARHSIAAVKAVTGDAVRREVIDNAKCGNCHEWFEAHGGNRVYDMKVCVLCHVPNLSTSGRAADPALIAFIKDQPVGTSLTSLINPATGTAYSGNVTQSAKDTMTALDAAAGSDPTGYPEDTNNFKEMIHGIHASAMRANDYTFVRDRGTSGVFYYDWAEVTFPGILNNCSTCHKDEDTSTNPDTPAGFALPVPANALPTTVVTSDGSAATTVTQDRASLPNEGDTVISPNAGACVYCHDSDVAKLHMTQNGAYQGVRSGYVATETCALCHGPGRASDVAEVHK